MKKIGMAILSLVAIVALSSSVYAADNGRMLKDRGDAKAKWEERRQELYKDLNLTEDQKKAIDANKSKNREEMKALFTQIRTARAALSAELQQEKLDMAKVSKLNNELKGLEAQSLDRRLSSILEVRKILTPEQFKKMMMKMEERKARFKHQGN